MSLTNEAEPWKRGTGAIARLPLHHCAHGYKIITLKLFKGNVLNVKCKAQWHY